MSIVRYEAACFETAKEEQGDNFTWDGVNFGASSSTTGSSGSSTSSGTSGSTGTSSSSTSDSSIGSSESSTGEGVTNLEDLASMDYKKLVEENQMESIIVAGAIGMLLLLCLLCCCACSGRKKVVVHDVETLSVATIEPKSPHILPTRYDKDDIKGTHGNYSSMSSLGNMHDGSKMNNYDDDDEV